MSERRFRRAVRDFVRDERAQTTTEYILMLGILLGLVILVIRDLIRPMFERLNAWVGDNISNRFFGGGFHQKFRVPGQ